MNPSNVCEVPSPTPFDLPENFALLTESDVVSNRLRTTGDLGTAFSLIGREICLQPQVRFRVVLEGKSELLDPSVFEHAYRIGREALLNAFHHSQATRIDLHLAHTPKGLNLTVRDNGQGISDDSVRISCNGLLWMKTWAERIGAKLKLLSRISGGTEVLLSIPGQIAYESEARRCLLGAA